MFSIFQVCWKLSGSTAPILPTTSSSTGLGNSSWIVGNWRERGEGLLQTVSIATYYVFDPAWTQTTILKRKIGYCGLYVGRRNYFRLRFPKPKPSRAVDRKLHIALIITLCIVTANDVQLNPGPPMLHNCTICDSSIR